MKGDDGRSEQRIREEIATLMFAALTNLDRDINRIVNDCGLSEEEDEWVEELPES